MDTVNDAFRKLYDIINREGFDYLKDKSYEVFLELNGKTLADKFMASAIFSTLVMGIPGEARKTESPEDLSKTIRKRCRFMKSLADQLAEGYTKLFSKENSTQWKTMEHSGLVEYLAEKQTVLWNGFAVWERGNCTMDCVFTAEIVIQPTEAIKEDKKLSSDLKKNPFLQKDKIAEYFEKLLKSWLENDFEEYCTEDDYYPPVVEDYELDYCVKEWCGKHGFNLISCKGSGEDKGFEPKGRRW